MASPCVLLVLAAAATLAVVTGGLGEPRPANALLDTSPPRHTIGTGFRISRSTACQHVRVPHGTVVSGGDAPGREALQLSFPNGSMATVPPCWTPEEASSPFCCTFSASCLAFKLLQLICP